MTAAIMRFPHRKRGSPRSKPLLCAISPTRSAWIGHAHRHRIATLRADSGGARDPYSSMIHIGFKKLPKGASDALAWCVTCRTRKRIRSETILLTLDFACSSERRQNSGPSSPLPPTTAAR